MPSIPQAWTRPSVAALVFSILFMGATAMADTADPYGPLRLDTDLATTIDADVANGKLPGLHAIAVSLDGVVVLERYYEGADQRWGTDLGHVRFGPDTAHDLRSVSKSVVGLLYGIALADGLVPPVDTPLVEHFPQYPDLAEDAQRRRITVAHALTMTMGLVWDESLPYDDPRNDEIQMIFAADPLHYALSRAIAEPPGAEVALFGWGDRHPRRADRGRLPADAVRIRDGTALHPPRHYLGRMGGHAERDGRRRVGSPHDGPRSAPHRRTG